MHSSRRGITCPAFYTKRRDICHREFKPLRTECTGITACLALFPEMHGKSEQRHSRCTLLFCSLEGFGKQIRRTTGCNESFSRHIICSRIFTKLCFHMYFSYSILSCFVSWSHSASQGIPVLTHFTTDSQFVLVSNPFWDSWPDF
jgi:hypothetical protein